MSSLLRSYEGFTYKTYDECVTYNAMLKGGLHATQQPWNH